MRCAPVTDLQAPGSCSFAWPLRLEQIPVKHVVDQRGFAGAGDAGDAVENAERDLDVEILQIVFARAGDSDRGRSICGAISERECDFRPAR